MVDYIRIQPWLLVGTFPESAHEVELLQRHEGVTAVLNLQTDEDGAEASFLAEHPETLYADTGIKLFRVPVRDFDESHLTQMLPECVVVLRRLLDQGHTVYLHCTAGINRSPTVAIAYLHWCQGWELDTAVKYIVRRRHCSPKVEAIRRAKWPPVKKTSAQENPRNSEAA